MAGCTKRGKLNNAGLSLVELLVAMTIIAIVSVAFYNGFVLAAKTNAKAKLQHKATSLAQNILEGLKAEDMDGILWQFAYPSVTATSGGSTSTQVNFRILNANIMENTYSSDKLGIFLESPAHSGSTDPVTLADYVTTDDGGLTAQYVQRDDGLYHLWLRNIKMENTPLDALITLDGSAYMESASGTSSSGLTYNTDEIAQLAAVNSDYDAVIGSGVDYDAKALLELQQKSGIDTLTSEALARELTVTITNEDIVGVSAPRQTVTAVYSYAYGSYSVTMTDTVYDNTGEEAVRQLRDLYLYYAPNYAAGATGDKITIVNNTGSSRGPYETTLYLIKQQTSTDSVTLSTDKINSTYKLQVNIWDSAPAATPGTANAIGICTNFGYALSDGDSIALNPLQAQYYHNGTWLSTDSLAKEYYSINTLANSRRIDVLFDVTVEVYQHNSGMDGTAVSSVDAFRDTLTGDLKATMTGSIRN